MTTQRQRSNLRRGGIVGTPATAARARAAKVKKADDRARLEKLAADDPWSAYEELHQTMTRHITWLLKLEEKEGSKPSRDVTDRLREYRQTTLALSEYRAASLGEREVEEFFATLDQRIASAQERVGPPKPPADLK